MSKSWRRLIGEEALAWGKAGALVGKDFAETTINEMGKVSGHKGKKFEFHTKMAMRDLVKQAGLARKK